MPTIHDKILLQAQNPSKVFLFKEGLFYKAYNQGAYLLRHKKYKVSVKKIKNSKNEVVSIGFPSTVFEALKKDFAIQDFESGKLSDWKNLPISKSLFHSQTNCGLPIGNLTSQLFSNVYLHCFDQWIKTNGQIKYYGRFVDDFIIIHQNKEYLISLLADIKDYLLSHDKLIFHPKKIYLQHYSKGFLFLGAYIKPYRTYIGNNTKTKFKALVLEYTNYFNKKTVPLATILKFRDSVNSYLGSMKHHKTFNLKHKTLFKKQPNALYNYGYFTSNLNIYKIKNNEL